MTKRTALTTLGVAAALLVITCPSLRAQMYSPTEKANQELVMNWYHNVIVLGQVNQASKYMADDYIEHDPRIPGGRAGFIQHYENASARPTNAKITASFAQGDYVVIVWEHADKDPKTSTPYTYATYDVVRVKDGKIHEHWNNAKKDSQW